MKKTKEEKEAEKVKKEEEKKMRKQFWSKKRSLGFLFFLIITAYDISADAAFFLRARQFLGIVQRGRATTNAFVIANSTFTQETLIYAPGCIEHLNQSIYQHPSQTVFQELFFETYDDITCLLGFKCEASFESNPNFNENNPNGTFLVAFENPSFWSFLDNSTGGDCQFSNLSEQGTPEGLIVRYQRATIACFILLLLSAVIDLVSLLHNYANFHRKNLATLYHFLQYVVEDMSQLCIQIFIFSYQIEIRCWLCLIESSCSSSCSGRPQLPQLPTNSDFASMDLKLNDSFILLMLNVAFMIFSAFHLILKMLYNLRKTRWIIPAVLASPFILLGLFTPLSWALWNGLLPLLGLANQNLVNACLAAAIIGTLVFPVVFAGMILSFYKHAKHDDRIREPRKSSSKSVEMNVVSSPSGP